MKKKFLLFFLLISGVAVTNAQTEQGRIQAGGNFGVSHYKSDEPNPLQNYTGIAVSPSFGRFYANNRLAGIFINYTYNKNTEPALSKNSSVGGGVYLRQYKPVLSKAFYILLQESAGGAYITTKEPLGKDHGFNTAIGLKPGIAYDITKKMQLEMLLNDLVSASYLHLKRTDQFALQSSLEGTPFNNLSVGFRFYL